MRPCYHVEITTPKKVVLNGLLFGSTRAKKLIIFVHGLTGSAFSMRTLSEALVDKDTAVLTFNNRGFEQIATVKRRVAKTTEYITAGTTHEVFAECVDDIQGAVNFARKIGYKSIYIAGHSTGCQKAEYWASKGGRGVKGLILLGPLSDYSGALKSKGAKRLQKGVAYARKLVAAKKPHALMPREYGEWFECDAQRFLSLYTPDSSEEIFTYARSSVNPTVFKRLKLPQLVLLAAEDEYGDMPAADIEQWFLRHLYEGEVSVIPNTNHAFKGQEKSVAKLIKGWCSQL